MSERGWRSPDRWALLAGRLAGTVGYAAAAIAAASPGRRWPVVVLVAITLSGTAYGWRWGTAHPYRRLAGVAGMGLGGIGLQAVDPRSVGWLAVGIAVATALARLPLRLGAITAAAIAAVAVSVAAAHGTQGMSVLGVAGSCAGFALLGVTLGGARQRAEAAERLLASEQAAQTATARAQVYAERQRLAREIHDVLAHTLSAQVVGLEGARLLLQRGAPAQAVLAQIEQAQRLARDGLEETRRAVYSLRGQARALPESLRALADAADAHFAVEGPPRPVEPEVGLALERTVQESLTNVRKHATGARTTVTLHYLPGRYAVEVCDTGAADGRSTLADSGAGYGLAGMRERAELLGGELSAAPHPVGVDGRGYRVWLTIPE